MAGHSKWSNIKQRKGAQDAKRSKIFQQLSREIYMAAKQGGPDPADNSALRMVLDKARANNLPNDNINRAIKKATDPGAGEDYKTVTYEGYGPDGVGVYVYALTDNNNRTSTNVRTAFTHNGGNLGSNGSVGYMFDTRGYIAIEREGLDISEDDMLMECLEAGALDLEVSDEVFEVYTEFTDLASVRDELSKNFKIATAERALIPKINATVSSENLDKFKKLLDQLEEDEDVSEVYHNADNPELFE